MQMPPEIVQHLSGHLYHLAAGETILQRENSNNNNNEKKKKDNKRTICKRNSFVFR